MQNDLFGGQYIVQVRKRFGKWKTIDKFDHPVRARASLLFRMEENPLYFMGTVTMIRHGEEPRVICRVHITGEDF